MLFNEIRKIAKGMNINTFSMKKPEVIRSIQRLERNMDCFGIDRVDYCGEQMCLWREDCIALCAKGSQVV